MRNNVIGLIFIVLIFSSLPIFSQSKQFTKAEIREDLAFLKTELESNHPNLYTYSSKEEMDSWFETKLANLEDSTNRQEAFRLVSSISSILKDGHSYIYPSAKHLADFYNSAPLFPLDVFLLEENFLVSENNSLEKNIPIGAKIITINGEPIEEIQSLIVEHTCRDGNNLEYPNHLLYKFFPAYYSFFYGFKETFEITFRNDNGQVEKVSVKGLTRNEMAKNRISKSEEGISLQILSNQKSAVLSIKSFDNRILKSEYSQRFKSEIRYAFKMIKDLGIENLAIDLRDNQGGALSNGVFLLKHFMTADFQTVNSYFVLKKNGKKQLTTKWDKIFKPKSKNHFKGNTFLFINGGSYSCSAIVANTFKENKQGPVLGQMTGGSAYVNSGAPNEVIILPNTGINFTIPKTQYILRENIDNIGLGVIPDILINDHYDRFNEGDDHYIEKFLDLVKE